jgi:steroid delta-isomerase
MMLSDSLLASFVVALVLLAPVQVAHAAGPEQAIRETLANWTRDFNAGNAKAVCALFSPELRYDFRGYPERDYHDICDRLQRSLADTGK